MDACKAIQIIEQTIPEVVLRPDVSDVRLNENEHLKSLDRIEGSRPSEHFIDLLGVTEKKAEELRGSNIPPHSVYTYRPVFGKEQAAVTKYILKNIVNNKNNLCSVDFKSNNDDYNIITGHDYALIDYDEKNNIIHIINPHLGTHYTNVPFDIFNETIDTISIVNLRKAK